MFNRSWKLAASIAMTLAVAGCDDTPEEAEQATGSGTSQETPAPSGNASDVPTGRYASEQTVVVLNADGSFEIIAFGQADGVKGTYEASGGTIRFSEVSGETEATFPMSCAFERTENGFRLGEGENCAYAGQEFAPPAG